MVDDNLCIGCGACASICPVNAIKLVNGKAQINKEKCIRCGACQQFCPVSAIDINKEEPKEKPTEKQSNK